MERDANKRHRLGRRAFLTGASAAAALSAIGLLTNSDEELPPPPPRARPVYPVANQADLWVEQVYSRCRNRVVNVVSMFPKGVPRRGLPVCLMLHGRFGDARKSAGGIPDWLTQAVARHEIPPYAMVAVDGGGNSYWHSHPGDDPMAMLLTEVPQWLAQRGLGRDANGLPFAVSGVSMGGFGALLYARRRRDLGQPLNACAVISPALITNWPEMNKRHAFVDQQEWASLDPMRHIDTLGDLPVGVWCGTNDSFITGTRKFIALAHPQVASTTPGGHTTNYYRHALPEAIHFLGQHLPFST